jgi:hypothetical protein
MNAAIRNAAARPGPARNDPHPGDRERYHVTERGITLVTPEMVGKL